MTLLSTGGRMTPASGSQSPAGVNLSAADVSAAHMWMAKRGGKRTDCLLKVPLDSCHLARASAICSNTNCR